MFKSLVCFENQKNPHGSSGNRPLDLLLSRRTPYLLGKRGGVRETAFSPNHNADWTEQKQISSKSEQHRGMKTRAVYLT